MIFRNAFQVMLDNFNKIYKYLLYRLVVILLTGSIFLAFFIPDMTALLDSFFASDVWVQIQTLASEVVKALVNSELIPFTQINTHMQAIGAAFSEFIGKHAGSITLTVLAALLLFIVHQFLAGVGDFVLGDMVNTHMSCYAEINFFSSLVKNIGKACRFLVVYVPLSFAFDLLTVAVCYFFFFFVMSFLPGFVAVFLSVTTILCAQTLKLTFTSNLMPCMIEGGMKIRDSVKYCFKLSRQKFVKMFSGYLVYVYVVVFVNGLMAVVTLGSGILLTLPASMLWLVCMRFVNYYTATGRKYFIAYDTIVLNTDRGETEKFFANNEMYEKTKMR